MNKKASPGNHEKVIREILRYLVEHPDAKDTVEGIAKWWLPKGSVERGKKAVQEAIDALAFKGWLTKRRIAPHKKIYGLNKGRLEQTKAFLSELESKVENYTR